MFPNIWPPHIWNTLLPPLCQRVLSWARWLLLISTLASEDFETSLPTFSFNTGGVLQAEQVQTKPYLKGEIKLLPQKRGRGCIQYKHRKNCECCHHHSLFKGHNVIVHIDVHNCQKCNQCLKCHVSGHKNFQKI